MWNQPYLSRGLNLVCGSNSLNSASGGFISFLPKENESEHLKILIS